MGTFRSEKGAIHCPAKFLLDAPIWLPVNGKIFIPKKSIHHHQIIATKHAQNIYSNQVWNAKVAIFCRFFLYCVSQKTPLKVQVNR